MLGLLRDGSSTVPGSSPATLEDLDTLVDGVRKAGVDVSFEVGGTRRQLGAGVELAAYRMVQESLTNVLKHSGATTARVEVRYSADSVDIEVADPGNGARPAPASSGAPAGGHGLLGLCERARLLGGTGEYEALPGSGFRVLADLPDVPAQVPS